VTDKKPIHFAHRFVLTIVAGCLLAGFSIAATETESPPPSPEEAVKPNPAAAKAAASAPSKPAAVEEKPAEKAPELPPVEAEAESAAVDLDDEMAAENLDAEKAAVAKPVSDEPIQIYGWREYIMLNGVAERLQAKLDTGALTSSIHAEEMELFERDGRKWVRFIVTDPRVKNPARTRIEAPLVRIARVKEPGGESVAREVVRLGITIGDRKLRGEFTLNNRSNMLAPVLIGRTMLKDLGLVDSGRTYLSEQKIFR
jgi:hypothetical protein